MSKFSFKQQSLVGDRVALPASFWLLIIIALSVFFSMLLSGDIVREEEKLQKQKDALLEEMSKNEK